MAEGEVGSGNAGLAFPPSLCLTLARWIFLHITNSATSKSWQGQEHLELTNNDYNEDDVPGWNKNKPYKLTIMFQGGCSQPPVSSPAFLGSPGETKWIFPKKEEAWNDQWPSCEIDQPGACWVSTRFLKASGNTYTTFYETRNKIRLWPYIKPWLKHFWDLL